VCQSYLPPSLINRKKRGFASNIVDDWFREAMGGKMSDTFMDSQSAIYKILKPKAVQQLHKSHTSGQSDNHKILFSLIVFDEWLRLQ